MSSLRASTAPSAPGWRRRSPDLRARCLLASLLSAYVFVLSACGGDDRGAATPVTRSIGETTSAHTSAPTDPTRATTATLTGPILYARIIDIEESPEYSIDFFAETKSGKRICVTYVCGDARIAAGRYNLFVTDNPSRTSARHVRVRGDVLGRRRRDVRGRPVSPRCAREVASELLHNAGPRATLATSLCTGAIAGAHCADQAG